jgi:hypothetical protein
MKPALAILAAALLLAGCGSAKDPFVGTWQAIGSASGDGLVISKVPNRYVVLMTDDHRGVVRYRCLRYGNELKATTTEPNPAQPTKPFIFVDVFSFDPAHGRLTWTEKEDGKGVGPRFVCTKVLDGTSAPTQSPAATSPGESSTTTYTNAAFHFSIGYDPSKLAAHIVSEQGQWSFPGVGHLNGPTLVLDIAVKSRAGLADRTRGELELRAVGPIRQLHQPTLAAFSREPFLRAGWSRVTSRPQIVRLNGLPAFRYSMRLTASDFGIKGRFSATYVGYAVYHDGFVYCMMLLAPTPLWPSVEPALNSVAQSFRLTP